MLAPLAFAQEQAGGGTTHVQQTAPEVNEARAQGGLPVLWLDGEPLPERAFKWFSTLPNIWYDSVLLPLADSGASVLNLRLARSPSEVSQETSAELGSSGGRPTARLALNRTTAGKDWQDKLLTDLAWRETPQHWSKRTRYFDPGGRVSSEEQEQAAERRSVLDFRLAPSFEIPTGDGGSWSIAPFLAHSGERVDRSIRDDTVSLAAPGTQVLYAREAEHNRNLLWRGNLAWAGPLGGWKQRYALLLQGSGDRSEEAREERGTDGRLSRLRRESDSGQDRETKLSGEASRQLAGQALSLGGEWREIRSREEETVQELLEPASQDRYHQLEFRSALWVRDEWTPAKGQRANLGLRSSWVDTRPTYPERVSRRYRHLLPSAGWRQQLDPLSLLKLSASRSVRLPKVSELSTVRDNAPDNDGLNPDLLGNPQLRPERSWNAELGMERTLQQNRGLLSATLGLRAIRDLIEPRNLLSQGRWVEVPYNIPRARSWTLKFGGRLNLASTGWQGGTLEFSTSHIGSRVRDPQSGQVRHIFDQPADLFGLDLAGPITGDWRGKFGWHYAARVEKGGPDGAWHESGQHTVGFSFSRPDGRDGRWQISLRDLLPEQLRSDQPQYQDGILQSRTRLKETAASQFSIAYIQKW
ncbi:TonB-dependent receptor [Chitinimonas sp.]|uniref:TonB-dependent receptor plug domain-containing protein n=1 Tax=Chitinimonas sp. TaxID=1934313 RepID=UPI002F940320